MKKNSSTSGSAVTVSPGVTGELLSEAQCYLKHCEHDDHAADAIEAAWSEFYEVCSSRIRRFAFRCGILEKDVADCLQEVWAELIVRLPIFSLDPSRGQFESWLFCIVQSKTVDIRRSSRSSLLPGSADRLHRVANHRAATDCRSDAKEVAEFAWCLLRKRLSALNLDVLRLRLVKQLSGADAARRLGLTHEQVRIATTAPGAN
ncbi:MAG: RNA polymerase sigma factor [Thermoguttaceae bacterium]